MPYRKLPYRKKLARIQSRNKLEQQRYGQRFDSNKFKAQVHRSAGGVCVCCMKARSDVVHHLRYVKPDGNLVKDAEKYPDDVVGVCNACHTKVCHSAENWIKNRSNPMLNRNTPEFHALLQKNWQVLNDRSTGKTTPKIQRQPQGKPTRHPRSRSSHSAIRPRTGRSVFQQVSLLAWGCFGLAVGAIVLLVVF